MRLRIPHSPRQQRRKSDGPVPRRSRLRWQLTVAGCGLTLLGFALWPPNLAAASAQEPTTPSKKTSVALPALTTQQEEMMQILRSAVSKQAPGSTENASKTTTAVSTHHMNLQQLWAQASQRFPGLTAARESIRAAGYSRDEQKWLRLPSGEVSAFLSWSPDVRCKSAEELGYAAGGEALTKGGSAKAAIGGVDNCLETTGNFNLLDGDIRRYLPIYGVLVRVDARITQPLYTFGKLDAALKLGEVGVQLAQASNAAVTADTAVNLVRAYFGLKAARAGLESIKEGQDQIRKWITQIDGELEAGKTGYTEIDLMRLKVTEATVTYNVVDIERTIRSSLAALRYLVQDPEADVDDGDLQPWAQEDHPLDYYLEAALRGRPELRTLMATGEGARLYKKLRLAELLPDFGLILGVNYALATSVQDPNHAFMNRLNGLGAGLGLGMRLGLDFGPKIARLQRSISDLSIFESRRREALGGGALEIERQYNDLIEAKKRLVAAESAERRSRGWLQGIKQNIDVGTAESRDMIEALRNYFEHHGQVLRATNDVNVQAAMLRRLSGLEVIPQ